MTETARYIDRIAPRLMLDRSKHTEAEIVEAGFADHWAGVLRRVPDAGRRAEIGRGLIVSMAAHLRVVGDPEPEVIARVVRVFGVTAERAGEICGGGV